MTMENELAWRQHRFDEAAGYGPHSLDLRFWIRSLEIVIVTAVLLAAAVLPVALVLNTNITTYIASGQDELLKLFSCTWS